jgi:UDPglucose 6-dehydrogenase
MKISFINAISFICEATGADVCEVANGIGMDKRIGRTFLNAGIGYGGFCFPKDLRAFIRIAEEIGYDFRLLREVERINEEAKTRFIRKIRNALWNIRDKTIGILGLSFKPNTDDMRFAPSIDIINCLLAEGAIVRAYDPQSMEKAKKILPDVELCPDPFAVANNADLLAILTEWDEFRELDWQKIKTTMRLPIIADGRNMLNREQMEKLGFIYIGVGR